MRIGVDLGGTKIEAAVLDGDGQVRLKRRIATPDNYPALMRAMPDLIEEIEAKAGAKGLSVGVGMPGSLSPATGLVRNSNSTWLNGKPFLSDIEAALDRPVRVANDANCFALSEAADGAGQGARVVFGAILGTGCGGGVTIDGKVMEGASGVAGEWGHTPLPWQREGEWPGPRCWCGKEGCLEKWISGTGFEDDFARHSGRELEAPDIMKAFEAGDAEAKAAFGRLADRVARAIAVLINILDPDVVVLGGGLSNVDELYPATAARVSTYSFSDVMRTRIVRNQHGDSSGVRGAAWLWPIKRKDQDGAG